MLAVSCCYYRNCRGYSAHTRRAVSRFQARNHGSSHESICITIDVGFVVPPPEALLLYDASASCSRDPPPQTTLRDASSPSLNLITLQCMDLAISRCLDLQLQYLRTLSALSLPHCRSHRTYSVRRVIPKRRSHVRYAIAGVAELQQISQTSWPMYCIAELPP